MPTVRCSTQTIETGRTVARQVVSTTRAPPSIASRRTASRPLPAHSSVAAPAAVSTARHAPVDAAPWNPWATPSTMQALPALGATVCHPPRYDAVHVSSSRSPWRGGSDANGGLPRYCAPVRGTTRSRISPP